MSTWSFEVEMNDDVDMDFVEMDETLIWYCVIETSMDCD
jgi:hypothetical protein